MRISGLAAVSSTVLRRRVQQLQIGSAEAADNSVLFPVLEGMSVFEPFEGHIRSILSLTLKLGCVANADVDRADGLLEHRLDCNARRIVKRDREERRGGRKRGR